MPIPRRVIDEVADRVSLVEVVSGYLNLERKGGRFWGLCPFHQEKTPSFSVSADQNVFYCFGCQKGGNLFSFVQDMENISFPEAVELLADRLGIEIPKDESPAASRRATLLELYSRVAGSFQFILLNSGGASDARRYLADRGVNSEMLERFSIGYAPGDNRWLYSFLKKKNYSEEFLDSSGLFSKRYKGLSLFSDRIMFPIRNRRGDTIAFGGRSLGDREPKYLNSPDSEAFAKRLTVYGINESLPAIRKAKSYTVVEGYLDVIAFHQAGLDDAVAPLGTAFTDEQVQMLRRYADSCTLVFDGDTAGVGAAEKSVASCEKAGVESNVVILPENRDPGDYMREGDYDSLENVLKNAQKGFIFILDQALRKNDVRGAGGKESALRYLLPFVDIAHSEVRRQAFLEEIADALRVSPEAVSADYERHRRGTEVQSFRSDEGAMISQDLYLMIAVALNRGEFRYVRTHIAAEDLQDTRATELYVALEECFRGEESSMDALLRRIPDESLQRLIIERAAREEFAESGIKIIRDAVARIQERTLKRKREDVTANLRKLEKHDASAAASHPLLEELMWIDSELQKLKERSN